MTPKCIKKGSLQRERKTVRLKITKLEVKNKPIPSPKPLARLPLALR